MTHPPQPSGSREPGSSSPAPSGPAATSPRQHSDEQPDAASSGPVIRRPLIVAAGCGALILLMLLSAGGVFAVRALLSPDDQPASQSQEETEAEEDEGDGSEDDAEGDGEESAETGGEADDDPEGENPDVPSDVEPQGTSLEHSGEGVDGTVEVSIGEVDWDATDTVQEQDQLVEELPAEQKYIMVEAELTYHGSEEFTPLAWASISFVGPDGTVYPDAGMATPSDSEQGTTTDGQTQTQEWVFQVPEDLPEGGHFVIGDFGPVEEGQWIEAD